MRFAATVLLDFDITFGQRKGFFIDVIQRFYVSVPLASKVVYIALYMNFICSLGLCILSYLHGS
jgi:hypothetical protein